MQEKVSKSKGSSVVNTPLKLKDPMFEISLKPNTTLKLAEND